MPLAVHPLAATNLGSGSSGIQVVRSACGMGYAHGHWGGPFFVLGTLTRSGVTCGLDRATRVWCCVHPLVADFRKDFRIYGHLNMVTRVACLLPVWQHWSDSKGVVAQQQTLQLVAPLAVLRHFLLGRLGIALQRSPPHSGVVAVALLVVSFCG